MPLIMMCGIPCSGKSTRAKEIADFFTKLGNKVIIVSEESLKLSRNEAYKDAKNEKMTRGTFLAEVERLVSADSILILDSLNYIKGYRYELYCRARTVRTPVPVEVAREWNSKRGEDKWSEELFTELAQRFELPQPRNKWDRPLFTLESGDKTPLDDIKTVLFDNPEVPLRNVATESRTVEEPNFLYEMDQITQSIIAAVLEAQNTGFIGDITVPKTTQKIYSLFFFLFC